MADAAAAVALEGFGEDGGAERGVFQGVERQLEGGLALVIGFGFAEFDGAAGAGTTAVGGVSRGRMNTPASRGSRNPPGTARCAWSPGVPGRARRRAIARPPWHRPARRASQPAGGVGVIAVATFIRSGWNSSTRTAARPRRSMALPCGSAHPRKSGGRRARRPRRGRGRN